MDVSENSVAEVLRDTIMRCYNATKTKESELTRITEELENNKSQHNAVHMQAEEWSCELDELKSKYKTVIGNLFSLGSSLTSVDEKRNQASAKIAEIEMEQDVVHQRNWNLRAAVMLAKVEHGVRCRVLEKSREQLEVQFGDDCAEDDVGSNQTNSTDIPEAEGGEVVPVMLVVLSFPRHLPWSSYSHPYLEQCVLFPTPNQCISTPCTCTWYQSTMPCYKAR